MGERGLEGPARLEGLAHQRGDAYLEGKEAHYRDARYYDQAYRRRRADVRYYVELGRRCGGPVLELGVGSGRVALALARQGVSVVGVDRMRPMLDRLGERLAREPRRTRERLRLVEGDLERVRLGAEFPLVIAPFNVWMHLYSRAEFEAAARTVLAHLGPGGRFVFDVLVPDAAALARDPERVYKLGQVRRDGRPTRYRERFRYDPITQVQHIDMIFVGEDGAIEVVELAHRQYFPAELEALLAYAGLRVEGRHGDFEGGPLDEDSESQILVCGR